MDAEVFTDQKVLDLISADYVPVRLDADKSEGKTAMGTFNVSGLPTIVLADAETKPLQTLVGYQDASQLADALEKTAKNR